MECKPLECTPIGHGYNSFTEMGWGHTESRCKEKKPHRHFLTPHEERTIYSPKFVPPPHYKRPPDWMYNEQFTWRERAVLARLYNPLDYAHDQGERDLSHRQFQPIDVYPDYYERKR